MIKISNSETKSLNVYTVAFDMIASSNRERDTMTAEEGEILREFFRQKARTQIAI